MRSIVVQGEAGPLQRGRGGRDRADAHHIGAAPRRAPRTAARAAAAGRSSSASRAGGHDAQAAASFWPLALPAVTVASGVDRRAGIGLSAAKLLDRRVGPRVLVAVDDASGLPRLPGTVTGMSLVVEQALLVGAPARCVRADRPLVLLLAADAVLAAQVLGRLDHAAGDGVVLPPAVSRARASRSMSCDAALRDAGAQARARSARV